MAAEPHHWHQSQESTLSIIAIEYQVFGGGDSGVPALTHPRLTLDGEDIQPTTYIPMPELAALKPFRAHVDRKWFDICVLKKSLVQIGPAEARPTFCDTGDLLRVFCRECLIPNIAIHIHRFDTFGLLRR
jgi:hypothetical protein